MFFSLFFFLISTATRPYNPVFATADCVAWVLDCFFVFFYFCCNTAIRPCFRNVGLRGLGIFVQSAPVSHVISHNSSILASVDLWALSCIFVRIVLYIFTWKHAYSSVYFHMWISLHCSVQFHIVLYICTWICIHYQLMTNISFITNIELFYVYRR